MIVIKLKMENADAQITKVTEEYIELVKEHLKRDKAKKADILGEGWDLIQSTLGYMSLISSEDEIKDSYKNHVQKLEDRNITGRVTIDEYYEL